MCIIIYRIIPSNNILSSTLKKYAYYLFFNFIHNKHGFGTIWVEIYLHAGEKTRIVDPTDSAQFPRQAQALIRIRDNIANDIIAMIEWPGSVGMLHRRTKRHQLVLPKWIILYYLKQVPPHAYLFIQFVSTRCGTSGRIIIPHSTNRKYVWRRFRD